MKPATIQPRNATLLAGWGYWDVTHFGRGGAFRRASVDTPVTVTGDKVQGEYPCTIGTSKALVDSRALRFEE